MAGLKALSLLSLKVCQSGAANDKPPALHRTAYKEIFASHRHVIPSQSVKRWAVQPAWPPDARITCHTQPSQSDVDGKSHPFAMALEQCPSWSQVYFYL